MSYFLTKYKVFIIILSLCTLSAKAQNILKIIDAKTEKELPYATIQLKNNQGKVFQGSSNLNGEINLSPAFVGEVNALISYVGYQTYEKKINTKKIKKIFLFPFEEEINPVIITASQKEIRQKESVFKIKVIDKESIEDQVANNLSDLLQNQSNIEIRQDLALGTNIKLQGLGGSNVKILIDGIPVIGRLNGNIDLNQINLNNVERVEIVEGPLSIIYGSNALAGVVNIITKKAQKNTIEAEINTYYESVGHFNIDTRIGYKLKKHFFQLSAGRFFFDGWNKGNYDRDMQWNPKESYFGDFNYIYRTNKDWFHRAKVNYFQDRLLDRKDPAGSFPIADDIWFKTRRADFAYILNGTFKKHFYLQSTNGFNYFSRIKNYYTKNLSTLESQLKENTSFNTFQDTTLLYQLTSRTFVANKNQDKKIHYQAGYDLNYASGKGQKFSEQNQKIIHLIDIATFATLTYKPFKKLSIQPAVRYGYNSKFVVLPTLSASIKYDFDKKTTWRISYGNGFRAPSLKEMYLDFQDINHNIVGNPKLKPERSHNVSTSLDYANTIKVHHYAWRISGFFNHKYNGISLRKRQNNTNETQYTYVNDYKYQTLGAEFHLKYKVKHFMLNTDFSYIGTYNTEKENNQKLRTFFYKPSMKLNASYHFIKWGLKLALFNKFVGNSFNYEINENDETVVRKIDAYNLLDFTASKTFWKKRIKLSAGIKNILNVSYVDSNISAGGVHSGGSLGTAIATGRAYFVQLKLKY